MTGRTVWFNCCAGVAGDMRKAIEAIRARAPK